MCLQLACSQFLAPMTTSRSLLHLPSRFYSIDLSLSPSTRSPTRQAPIAIIAVEIAVAIAIIAVGFLCSRLLLTSLQSPLLLDYLRCSCSLITSLLVGYLFCSGSLITSLQSIICVVTKSSLRVGHRRCSCSLITSLHSIVYAALVRGLRRCNHRCWLVILAALVR